MTEMNELYEIQNLIYEAKSIDSTEINSRLLKLEKKILSLENTFNQLKNININNDLDDKIKINELSNKEILSKLNDIDLELSTTFCTQSIDETIKLYRVLSDFNSNYGSTKKGSTIGGHIR